MSAARVLFVDHTASLGGGEIALLNLVSHLDPERYSPVVLLCSEGPLVKRLKDAGVEVHVLALPGGVANTRKDTLGIGSLLRAKDLYSIARYVPKLRNFIRHADVALVHTNSLKADLLGGIAGWLAGVPTIWHVRDRIEDDYLPPLVARTFRVLARFLPDYVIANSAATLMTLHLPKDRGGTHVYSGIDLGRSIGVVHDGTHEANESDLAGGPRAVPTIGLVGRISPWKGQHIFLQAAAEIRKSFPAARFQIIGGALFEESEYEARLHRMVEELKLGDVVEFTGFRNDVSALIGQLDVLVHASTTGEPFGQVVIEGMAAGKPVVATRGGGIPEIVLDGETGFLVPMGDAPAMAQAVVRLLASPQLCAELGAAGRNRVRKYFTIEQSAHRVQRVYDGMLQGGKFKRNRPGAASTDEDAEKR